MVVEVPRWENAKLDIAKDEFLSPLRQDIIDDTLRFVPNIFPHKGPAHSLQVSSSDTLYAKTWDDPTHIDPFTTYPGGDDALDVCKLAGNVASAAQVKQVKVLGTFAVIEALKADWKVIVVDTSNPLAGEMHDIGDVERHLPGYLETMLEWFRVYKMLEERASNEIAGQGDWTFKGREYGCLKSWRKVLTEPTMETKVSMADVRIQDNNLAQQIPKHPREDTARLAKLDASVANKSRYVSSNWPISGNCAPRTLEV
ncbi:Inorganic pyrophosphatase [Aspergillus sp. HF37]|nr:Inorganic pyrophosphatase [Aspergillus sp. HF37]